MTANTSNYSTVNGPAPAPVAPAVGNTKAVGYAGLTTAAIGIFGPVVVAHAFPNLPDDVRGALSTFFLILASGGAGASYIGMPFHVGGK